MQSIIKAFDIELALAIERMNTETDVYGEVKSDKRIKTERDEFVALSRVFCRAQSLHHDEAKGQSVVNGVKDILNPPTAE